MLSFLGSMALLGCVATFAVTMRISYDREQRRLREVRKMRNRHRKRR